MSVRQLQSLPEDYTVKRRKIQNNTTDSPNISNKSNVDSKSDILDPIEKLLSFANRDDDFFSVEESEPEFYDEQIPEINSTRIRGMMDANLKLYYSQLHSRQRQVGDSSFASLNIGNFNSSNTATHESTKPKYNYPEVPFFRAVNFNPTKSSKAYEFDDYLSYPDLEDDDNSSDSLDQSNSEDENVTTPTLSFSTLNSQNMSFHYRHNDNLNLSSTQPEKLDIFKALNKRCILNGKASEIVSTGQLLINDFYL